MEIASRPEDVPPWQMSGKDDLDEVIAAAVWPFNFHLFATIDSQCLLVTSKKKNSIILKLIWNISHLFQE